jgi:hypothetical protein
MGMRRASWRIEQFGTRDTAVGGLAGDQVRLVGAVDADDAARSPAAYDHDIDGLEFGSHALTPMSERRLLTARPRASQKRVTRPQQPLRRAVPYLQGAAHQRHTPASLREANAAELRRRTLTADEIQTPGPAAA